MNLDDLIERTKDTDRPADLSGQNLAEIYFSGGYTLKDFDLSEANLTNANLRDLCFSGVNLSRANLTGADISGADLGGADLTGTILPKIDFTPIPEPELARQIIQLTADMPNSLNMQSWHTCANIHCVWGWAIVLNGKGGEHLEDTLGTQAAGALLFPGFSKYVFEGLEEAMEKLREIAAGNA
jgi:hypothetical protein